MVRKTDFWAAPIGRLFCGLGTIKACDLPSETKAISNSTYIEDSV